MGNPEQFSEEYRRGFEDALKASIIIAGFCGDIEIEGESTVQIVSGRIAEVTPELYAGWREFEKAESRNPPMVEVPDGGA